MAKPNLKQVQQPAAAPVAQPAAVPPVADGPVIAMPAVVIPGVRLRAIATGTPGDVADRLGAVKALISQLCEVEASLKASLVGAGVAEADGVAYRATVSDAVRCTLDAAAIRESMGDAWCARFEYRAVTTTVRVTARKRS
jgi:hypothetical protein